MMSSFALLSGGYGSTSKEFCWLISAVAGILMSKAVYDLTGLISKLFFKRYAKLNDAQKLEWNNRGFSTFHAIFVAIASFYLIVVSDLFDEGSHPGPIVSRRSALSDTVLGISIGYFLTDLAMIFWSFPALGGMEYVVHHGLSLYSIFLALVSGQGQVYILMVLFTESTTPFVNLRWRLDVAGLKSSKLYLYNGVSLFFGWLIARIFLFVYLFYHMATHFDQVKMVFPLGFYSLLMVPSTIAMMNLFWFWKIAKGMMKTLAKARHNP